MCHHVPIDEREALAQFEEDGEREASMAEPTDAAADEPVEKPDPIATPTGD